MSRKDRTTSTSSIPLNSQGAEPWNFGADGFQQQSWGGKELEIGAGAVTGTRSSPGDRQVPTVTFQLSQGSLRAPSSGSAALWSQGTARALFFPAENEGTNPPFLLLRRLWSHGLKTLSWLFFPVGYPSLESVSSCTLPAVAAGRL